ncbi:MAG: hypothetical protein WCA08_02335 [Desulfoferrobacter sp.]
MNPEFREELKELVQKQGGPCVSIFMPTHRVGAEVQQNPIRLKNLLRESEQQLVALGTRQADARELLSTAQGLLADGYFWRQQADGLAVFIASDVFRTYSLPIHFDELSVVTDRFHLKPLLRVLAEDDRFFVLALSQKELRVFECTRFGVSLVELESVPKSIDEALKYDDPQRQLQFHTGTQGRGGGKRAAMFHGQGVGVDDNKSNIWRYCLMINDGLHKLLRDEHAPLVLAGVDYLLPIYREANGYPHLLETCITGNPDVLSADELHSKAWEIVLPHFKQEQEEAMAKYLRLAGTGLASGDLREIVPAAYFGRVESVFLPVGKPIWGSFDPQKSEIDLHAEAQPGDQDLLDLVAIQTFTNGGAVYVVEPGQIANKQLAAAVFRY